MDKLSSRLDLVRRNWGMTLEEFGNELGYGKARTAARQVMSRILKGHRNPTLENLKNLQKKDPKVLWKIMQLCVRLSRYRLGIPILIVWLATSARNREVPVVR